MKISTDELDKNPGLKKPVPDGNTAGQPYETVDALAGTIQMDKLNDEMVVVLIQQEGNRLDLKTIALP